ncbi:MAG: UDP-3-O-(3-hydroxymyristoyl)glucosamine N-acyltransferase [Gemmataceae bacterium]
MSRLARKKGRNVSVTIRQLAEWVRGEVLGDADLPIENARALTEAGPGDITLVDGERHLADWHNSKASAAVVPKSVPVNGKPIIRVADPLMAFVDIVRHLRGRPSSNTHTIDPAASVHPTAKLSEGVTIGAFAVVGEGSVIGANTQLHPGATVGRGCRIGADSVLFPRVVVYDDCTLGDRVIVHANAVIGADGFGYRFQNGRHEKVPQLGWVEIEDDVEIGACTTIDRGTFGATKIGAGTKIDNQVQVAHNCVIGKHNILAAQVGIAGSCTFGDYVVVGGQAGFRDHVHLGNRTMIAAKAGVNDDVPDGTRVFGYLARPESTAKRVYLLLDRLPQISMDIRKIKKQLGIADTEKAA